VAQSTHVSDTNIIGSIRKWSSTKPKMGFTLFFFLLLLLLCCSKHFSSILFLVSIHSTSSLFILPGCRIFFFYFSSLCYSENSHFSAVLLHLLSFLFSDFCQLHLFCQGLLLLHFLSSDSPYLLLTTFLLPCTLHLLLQLHTFYLCCSFFTHQLPVHSSNSSSCT
jgi:hypothetical protein